MRIKLNDADHSALRSVVSGFLSGLGALVLRLVGKKIKVDTTVSTRPTVRYKTKSKG